MFRNVENIHNFTKDMPLEYEVNRIIHKINDNFRIINDNFNNTHVNIVSTNNRFNGEVEFKMSLLKQQINGLLEILVENQLILRSDFERYIERAKQLEQIEKLTKDLSREEV